MPGIFRENELEGEEVCQRLLCVECASICENGLFSIMIPKICSDDMFNGMAHPCNLVLQKRKANCISSHKPKYNEMPAAKMNELVSQGQG